MKTLVLNKSLHPQELGLALKTLSILFILWWLIPPIIRFFSPMAGMIDAGIWQLILLALICWLILLGLAALLTKNLYQKLTLLVTPHIHLPLNTLTLWQHYILYWASFALLVLSATGCLIAIC